MKPPRAPRSLRASLLRLPLRSPRCATLLICALSPVRSISDSSRNRKASALTFARFAAASSKAAPSSVSATKSETPASNFAVNSRCQPRKTSAQASTVYS